MKSNEDALSVVCPSLLKVHLQLRGFTVFIDIERLRAGKFDESLLESVRQANSFIIVLTPNALDRCIGDDERKDWVHKVRVWVRVGIESGVEVCVCVWGGRGWGGGMGG